MTKEELIQFLQENLRVTTKTNYDCSSVCIQLWLGDDELSYDWITLK